jgi:hypothetical protein
MVRDLLSSYPPISLRLPFLFLRSRVEEKEIADHRGPARPKASSPGSKPRSTCLLGAPIAIDTTPRALALRDNLLDDRARSRHARHSARPKVQGPGSTLRRLRGAQAHPVISVS